MSKKDRKQENLKIEISGKAYYGSRVIEGTRKLDQYIIYEDKCLPDLKGYSPSEKDKFMLVIAKTMLSELATGRTISAQPCSKFGL